MVTAPPKVVVEHDPPTETWKAVLPAVAPALEPWAAMPPEPPMDWATTPWAKSPSVRTLAAVALPEPSCPSIVTLPPLPPASRAGGDDGRAV